MWVSPDWVSPSRSAARVKLPSSTAVSMASHFFVSMASPFPQKVIPPDLREEELMSKTLDIFSRLCYHTHVKSF